MSSQESAQDAEDLETLPGYSQMHEQREWRERREWGRSPDLTSGLACFLWEKRIKNTRQKEPGNESIYLLRGFVHSNDPGRLFEEAAPKGSDD